MHALDWHLANSTHVEALPARLLRPRARANADARALALAPWCLRRKSDGRFLAPYDGRRLACAGPVRLVVLQAQHFEHALHGGERALQPLRQHPSRHRRRLTALQIRRVAAAFALVGGGAWAVGSPL